MDKYRKQDSKSIMGLMCKDNMSISSSKDKVTIDAFDCADITSLYIPFRDYFISSRDDFDGDKNRENTLGVIDTRMLAANDKKDFDYCYDPDTYKFYIISSRYFSKLNHIMINYLHNVGVLTKQGTVYKRSNKEDNKLGTLMYRDVFDYLNKQKFLYKTSDFTQIIYGLTQKFSIYADLVKDSLNNYNLRGLYFAMYLLDYDIYKRVSILPDGHVLSFSTYTLVILNLFSNLLNGKKITNSNPNAVKTVDALIDLIPLARKVNHIMQDVAI